MRIMLLGILLAAVGCNKEKKEESIQSGPDWRTQVVDGEKVNVNLGDLFVEEIGIAPAYPTLIGGAPADMNDWPSSFYSKQGNSRCTSTLLAPNVLQTAAHCVGNGRTAVITSQGKDYSGKCTHSPKYRNDSTADYALCLMQEPVDVKWYEGVVSDDEAKSIKVGDNLLLAGMGCNVEGGGSGSGTFRIGEAPIIRLPIRNNDTVTSGNAALCYGDSGGSVFWKNPQGVYKVVAINSRGDIRKTSYLSSVFTKDGRDFYMAWSADNSAKICGLASDAVKCRGAEMPDPTPVPPWCAATLEKFNRCVFGNPRMALSDPEGCRDAYVDLFACEVAAEQKDDRM